MTDQPKRFLYRWSRYLCQDSKTYDTIEECIRAADSAYEFGEEWPISISEDGRILWKSCNPMKEQKLAEFAKENGVCGLMSEVKL